MCSQLLAPATFAASQATGAPISDGAAVITTSGLKPIAALIIGANVESAKVA
jgi:hypothetical protein